MIDSNHRSLDQMARSTDPGSPLFTYICTTQALVPEPDLSRLLMAERQGENGRKAHIDPGSIPLLNSVLWSGLLTAFSLALHNFPGALKMLKARAGGSWGHGVRPNIERADSNWTKSYQNPPTGLP